MKLSASIVGAITASGIFAAAAAEPAHVELDPIPPVIVQSTSSPPLPQRPPKMTIDAAIARAARFLQEHNKDAAKYYVSGAHYISFSDKPNEDCWRVEWTAKESSTKPPMLMILVYDETHVFFGAFA